MKLLLIPLLLAGAGAGWYGYSDSPEASEVPAACDPSGCRVTVEPTPRGTCIVTCYEEDGSIRCQEEVECDGPCDSPCEKPCEQASSCSR